MKAHPHAFSCVCKKKNAVYPRAPSADSFRVPNASMDFQTEGKILYVQTSHILENIHVSFRLILRGAQTWYCYGLVSVEIHFFE